MGVGEQGDVWRAALQCPTTPQIPSVLQSGNTLCTAYRPQIQWYRNGEALPDATTPCITTDATGNYTVVIADALGCIGAPSAPVQVIEHGGRRKFRDTSDALPVFPNPTDQHLTLRFANDGPHALELCDAQGRSLRSETVQGSTAQLDLAALPAGLYVVRKWAPGAGGAGDPRVRANLHSFTTRTTAFCPWLGTSMK